MRLDGWPELICSSVMSVNGHDEVVLRVPGKGFRLCPEDIGETWTNIFRSSIPGTFPLVEIPIH